MQQYVVTLLYFTDRNTNSSYSDPSREQADDFNGNSDTNTNSKEQSPPEAGSPSAGQEIPCLL